jgi:tetratricopeptide (TPR) repeat protein
MIVLHDIVTTPAVLAAKMRSLERQGRYDEALAGCLEIVDGKACVPSLDAVSPAERAELLLRFGALIGFLGHNSQIADSQEQSKDLLTMALAEFTALGDEEKAAECENYMALAYWRKGELNEAIAWVETSLRRECRDLSEARIYAHVVASLINLEGKRFRENVDSLRPLEENFIAFGDPLFLGHYYANLGISLKDLGDTSAALKCFELARYYRIRSKHKIYVGTIENNLAQLYWLTGDFVKAYAAIDRATKVFRRANDKTRVAYSLDTKAKIFLAEQKYQSALRTINKAVDMLRRGENAAYTVEALMTRSKILLHLDRFSDAILSLFEAVEINRLKLGDGAVRELISGFEVETRNMLGVNRPADEIKPRRSMELELLLPASLANFATYSGVWIQNNGLERFGLRQGSLAIVVDQDVERGDLVAAEELNSHSIVCGVYDHDFGMICLDKGDDEPQIYVQSEIEIVGKIVGVGQKNSKSAREIIVQPISN